MRALLVLSFLVCTGGYAAEPAPLTQITTAELAGRAKGPSGSWNFSLIDARTAVEFGEGHIIGALSVPVARVRDRLPTLVKDKGRTLVFYCNGPRCTKSRKAARLALESGYTHVLEYNEGLPAWARAGLPTEGKPLPSFEVPAVPPQRLAAALEGKNPPLLIDIRDADEFATFHLKGAVNVPLDEIQGRLPQLPTGQALVVVDHAGHQTGVCARLLHSLGRAEVGRLDGGLLAWQAAGLPVETGPSH